MKTKQLKVGFPETDRAQLRELARVFNMPEAELIRRMVRKALQEWQRTRPRAPTAPPAQAAPAPPPPLPTSPGASLAGQA